MSKYAISCRLRSTSPRRKFRGGLSTLELALTLMTLLYVCFGTVEFGYYFFVKNTIEGAAREGARAAIVSGATNASVITAADNVLYSAGLATTSTNNYTIAVTDTNNNPVTVANVAVGNPVEVTVSGVWGTVGNGFRPLQMIGAAKVVTGATVMRKEG